MPNWCSNVLRIKHSNKALINAILRAAANDAFFEEIIPFPRIFNDMKNSPEDCRAKCGYYSSYEWCIDHWGTKWEPAEVHVDLEHPPYVIFRFDTAWTPPIPVYMRLVELGCDVDALYFEPGCGFAGMFRKEQDICLEIPRDLKELPEELVDEFNIISYYQDEEENCNES